MTLRERIADWISGGALTRMERMMQAALDASFNAHLDVRKADCALHRIAACETEKANATVRRMAKIAREAME